jgi:hypothetical protein
MGYVKPFKAENALAPTSQLEGGCATHAAYADDNDVIYHSHLIDQENKVRSSIRANQLPSDLLRLSTMR